MEPQNTQSTQMKNAVYRAKLLSKQIIGCALTVLYTPGLEGVMHFA